jgi:hypothetical protein
VRKSNIEPHSRIGERSGAPTTFSTTQGLPARCKAARGPADQIGVTMPPRRVAQ